MIKLPDKGRCKRKEFSRAMKLGYYVCIDFMSSKIRNCGWECQYDRFGEKIKRDMTPRPKIFKVIDRNTLELVYLYNSKEDKWLGVKEMRDPDYDRVNSWAYLGSVIKPRNNKWTYKLHNIWSWFQRDEVRDICVMTKEELIEKYIWELL